MNPSISETAILLAFMIVSLALACAIARYPKKASAGIGLGVLAGIVLLWASYNAVAFLGYILPFGQIDVWLASLISRVF